MIDEIIGETYYDKSGEFQFFYDDDSDLMKRHGEEYGIYLVVYNRKNVMISNGRYRYGEQYLDVKWYTSPSVRFDMVFSAKEENQDPPDWGSLFK